MVGVMIFDENIQDDDVRHVISRAQSGKKVSAIDTRLLVESLDFDELLPLSLKLDGLPMDIINRRPVFRPLFKKDRKTDKEVYGLVPLDNFRDVGGRFVTWIVVILGGTLAIGWLLLATR